MMSDLNKKSDFLFLLKKIFIYIHTADRSVWPVRLTGLSDRSGWPVCMTGLADRFVWPVSLAGLSDRLYYRSG
jgi:hypothetical protein